MSSLRAKLELKLAAKRELEKRLNRKRCEEDFAFFVRQSWPVLEPAQPLMWGRAMDMVCDHLEALDKREITRLIVNIPPGFSKSTLLGVMFPAWVFTKEPTCKIISVAHNLDLALRDSVRCRRLIQSEWYQDMWPHVKLSGDQNAKCLAKGSKISMADGSFKNIEDVKPGDKVLSYDINNNKMVTDTVNHVWSPGIKKANKITLSDKTEIIATPEHRFYAWDDFKRVDEISINSPISVIDKLPSQYGEMTKDEAFILALWLAEGNKANTSYFITNESDEIINRLHEISKKYGWSVKKYQKYSYTVTAGQQFGYSPKSILKKYIGEEKTYGNRSKLKAQAVDTIDIPQALFAASDEVVSEFIGTYVATDGSITCAKNRIISICTASETLARSFAMLMKRFGVYANITTQNAYLHYDGTKKQCKDAWKVSIASSANILKLSNINFYHKNKKFIQLLEWCHSNRRTVNGGKQVTIPPHELCLNRWSTKNVSIDRAIDAGRFDILHKIKSDLSWRSVIKIEDIGEVETWHIETNDTHLFFVNGMLSHNSKFEIDGYGGFRQALAAGSVTGTRADHVIVDDPLSATDAMSEAIRNSMKDWILEAVPTRLNNPGGDSPSTISLIMQRLHEEDTTGVLLERNLGYVHLMLPMEYDPARHCETPIGGDWRTEEGELLFPERFPREVVDRDKQALGPWATASQFQQSPSPRGGGLIRRDQFMLYDEECAKEQGKPDANKYPDMDLIVASIDTAYTTKQENDASAITVWGIWQKGGASARSIISAYTDNTNVFDMNGKRIEMVDNRDTIPCAMLMYAKELRVPLHGDELTRMDGESLEDFRRRCQSKWGLCEHITDICKRFNVDVVLIEAKASGISVAQEIKRLNKLASWSVKLVNPGNLDKVARVYSIQPIFSNNQVYAPDKDWADKVITQCEVFPRGRHDDLVDTVSQALRYLRDNGFLSRADEVGSRITGEYYVGGNKKKQWIYDV